MSKIISHGHDITCVEHALFFEHADCPGAGFSFTCSPDGDVLVPENEAAQANLAYCLANPGEFNGPYVEDFTRRVSFGPTVRCDCGSTVHCDDSWANGCPRCEREYNRSGQQLAPRSQWGSEWVTQPEEDYGLYPA